jgi:hypothetical protein
MKLRFTYFLGAPDCRKASAYTEKTTKKPEHVKIFLEIVFFSFYGLDLTACSNEVLLK